MKKEKTKTRASTVRLVEQDYERLDKVAEAMNISRSALLRLLILDNIEEYESRYL